MSLKVSYFFKSIIIFWNNAVVLSRSLISNFYLIVFLCNHLYSTMISLTTLRCFCIKCYSLAMAGNSASQLGMLHLTYRAPHFSLWALKSPTVVIFLQRPHVFGQSFIILLTRTPALRIPKAFSHFLGHSHLFCLSLPISS